MLPGEVWKPKILENLEKSHIVIMLVSAHSLFSDFIQNTELKTTLNQVKEGKTRLVPILIKECLYEMADELYTRKMLPFHLNNNEITAVEDWESKNKAWKVALQGLQKVIDDINSKLDEEEKIKTKLEKASNIYKFGKYSIPKNGTVLKARGRGGFEKDLTPNEAKTLKLLLDNRNKVVLYFEILEKIWGKDDTSSRSQLSTCIGNLKKLIPTDERIDLDNKRNEGYFLNELNPLE
ncbi:MAG: winged helix-turn-helix domain-containing protein [Saprospiraceae bacterium]|nr:winged helix-turn-helix domain-containing protein [Saprospiraceae bacterium]